MEQSTAHPIRPASARPVDAFDAYAWHERREIEKPMFVRSPADEQTFAQFLSDLPGWAVISAGGVVSAILGAMVGGALHI